MSVTEQEAVSTEEKLSALELAYKLKRELGLELTAKQFIELNNIMCDLAVAEFQRGLDKGFEIGNKYRN